MFQTSYTGITALHNNQSYQGGFCHFYYVPVEGVGVFPRINPATQQLAGEPALKPGYTWYGPIAVPRNTLGFEETPKRIKAGIYYESKVDGIHPGDSELSRINMGNMAYHKYIVVGKMRAGGFYLLVGTTNSPLEFNPGYKSGNGPGEIAQSAISFKTEHKNKAYILPGFTADSFAPVDGGTIDIPISGMNTKEIIPFVDQGTIGIPWTPLRANKFGSFPIVEVYTQEPGEVPQLVAPGGGQIIVDAPPPAFTEMTVRLPGAPTGFVVIS
jgi:hypothetical protein